MFRTFKSKCIILALLVLAFVLVCYTPSHAKNDEKISLMYLYGNSNKYLNQINMTNNSVNTVSPNYFNLDSSGNLLTTVDPSFVKTMHNKGIKVTPFLGNHWDRELGQVAIRQPEKLSEDILKELLKYNLDGINIDIENLTYEDREAFTTFISILKQKLTPHNLTLSIAVGAIDKPTTVGWKSTFDLKKLSIYADYIVVMAYDEHWEGGGPGPVASIPWVKRCTDYMLTQIPKEKYILGVPFYGRMWTNEQNGVGITYPTLTKKIQENNAQVKWNNEFKTPYVKYKNAEGNNVEIWFENAKSLKEKFELVNKYDIAGVAGWRLGQEDTTIWNDFSEWLYKGSFIDIFGHWAQKDIIYLTNQGFIAGKDPKHYDPDMGITRAEAVSILSRILNWSNGTQNPFIDVPNNHWAKAPILSGYSNDIIKGTSTITFSPNKNLTRAELTVLLKRSFDLKNPNNSTNGFYDVLPSHWAHEEILTLKNLGFIAGREFNQFYPNEIVTRAEFAAMVARILR
ncbi:Spore germination protein YaaH [Desulfonispora thiosulfatigenes DSM 11270]|uniref:Spore germination protein YaaH n=1 Tax=Desulfonispora thiosulfatigenes DSM 11270 TaxID=656914 RepID=A0A1W1VGE5_DESTI|nr:glycosyl hydrolase family 18 protein [Desulfonispora thiosulfatigenes]SMB92425.1 Spore germination protein YaaH [Desulfonispora thiosulfatigenes DSM 11270]